MSDTRFYWLLLVGFAVFVIIVLCVMDLMQQPADLNREFIKQIIGIVAPIFAALLVMLNSNSNRQQLQNGQQSIIQPVQNAAARITQKADELANTANSLPKEVKAEVVLHTDKP